MVVVVADAVVNIVYSYFGCWCCCCCCCCRCCCNFSTSFEASTGSEQYSAQTCLQLMSHWSSSTVVARAEHLSAHSRTRCHPRRSLQHPLLAPSSRHDGFRNQPHQRCPTRCRLDIATSQHGPQLGPNSCRSSSSQLPTDIKQHQLVNVLVQSPYVKRSQMGHLSMGAFGSTPDQVA